MIKKKVTIKQIASDAGVSVATVSRVFNSKNPEKVGKEARKRVQDVIKKYNYIPSIYGKGLASGRSSLIGVQLLSMTSPLSNVKIIEGLEKAASDKNYNIILGISNWDHECETESINVMLDKGVDGIIWQPVDKPNPELLRKISMTKHPLVWCNKDCGGKIPGAFNDEEASGKMALEYLFSCGCKNPAFICIKNERHAMKRKQGWIKAAQDNKIKFKEIDLKFSGRETFKIGFEAIIDLFEDKNRIIDGAFLTGATLAMGAYAALHELQIARRDFPILGHNLFAGEESYIPIPCISPQSTQIGFSVFDILNKLINGENTTSVYFPPVFKDVDFKIGYLY